MGDNQDKKSTDMMKYVTPTAFWLLVQEAPRISTVTGGIVSQEVIKNIVALALKRYNISVFVAPMEEKKFVDFLIDASFVYRKGDNLVLTTKWKQYFDFYLIQNSSFLNGLIVSLFVFRLSGTEIENKRNALKEFLTKKPITEDLQYQDLMKRILDEVSDDNKKPLEDLITAVEPFLIKKKDKDGNLLVLSPAFYSMMYSILILIDL